ncbi:uncharacterized protein N7503_008632 [Penicillium pulvis]|uniref:uncharacterized protein n=1 Tax=Penicillium pulvis TaxID=1562058 RepID=UPI0025489F10|nr:uncharacterized protein N7503_008632 [Penicillium pulvis]KAJ5792654.1 hypothetical protein N7503_008632 [Penicillium pulvis]
MSYPESGSLADGISYDNHEEVGYDELNNELSPVSAKTVAQHVAAHLHVLMLLTIRLASLQTETAIPESEIESDVVDVDQDDMFSRGHDFESEHISNIDSMQAADVQTTESPPLYRYGDMARASQQQVTIPDLELDVDWDSIPRCYERLAEKDEFLQGIIKLGACQSHFEEPTNLALVMMILRITKSIMNICSLYIQEVNVNVQVDIAALQKTVSELEQILGKQKEVLKSPREIKLPNSLQLADDITECLFELESLEKKITPKAGTSIKPGQKIQSLKWPLRRTEMNIIIMDLQGYKIPFTIFLQINQEALSTSSVPSADHAIQSPHLAQLPFAPEALFDSHKNIMAECCLPGTRTRLLHSIMDWLMSRKGKQIFWLNGMAGTGKSTISRSVAKSLKDTNLLGASFFFSGGRENSTMFFPTLARQLVQIIPGLGSSVHKISLEDPQIASRSPEEQFKILLLEPLLELDQLNEQQPRFAVIVIDALDECENSSYVQKILQLLSLLQKVNNRIHLRIFLTSRPELPIQLGLSSVKNQALQDIALHEISSEEIKHDIGLFLKERFTGIRNMRNLPEDWPGDNVIQDLVTMSSPLFLYAATICRLIEDPDWDPQETLAGLISDQARYTSITDRTYLPILTRLLDDQDEPGQQQLLQEFQKIVGVIVLLAAPLSINSLSVFLEIDADQISNRLVTLQSVLIVPSDRERPINMLHLSFRDFLIQTKSKFLVDGLRTHQEIAHMCLKTMQRYLRKNICHLKSPGTHRGVIDSLYLHQHVPPELMYSCRYWVHHLEHNNFSLSEIERVETFLQTYFLYWVEVMSLLGLISDVVEMLNILQRISTGARTISKILYDAKRFVLQNLEVANEAPLQLYCSGLIFAPQTSMVRRQFKFELPSWISQLPQVEHEWSAEILALEGHLGPVQSVAFSPDGQLLASGSDDNNVRLWHAATGTLQLTLDGHLGPVQSVAFSSDGRLLASGSDDKTVRLWDIVTGALQHIFESESGPVQSVAFSPDGRVLASGSGDKVVLLWDVQTGSLLLNLKDHLGPVRSVAFAPDRRLLASGSDRVVRLWDTKTGVLQQTLEAESGPVQSVAFSPDSRLLAYGSEDKVVKIWDVATGTLQLTLEGHLGPVQSVAFSPDDQLLASHSNKMVWLWNIATGTLQQAFEGHLGPVQSVAFSPDSRLLASGSDDKMVRLWDLTRPTGPGQQTSESHASPIQSMVFSPDGQLLASGSNGQVQVWNTATGALQDVFHIEGIVTELDFSLDASYLRTNLGSIRTNHSFTRETGVMASTAG